MYCTVSMCAFWRWATASAVACLLLFLSSACWRSFDAAPSGSLLWDIQGCTTLVIAGVLLSTYLGLWCHDVSRTLGAPVIAESGS